LLLAPQMCTNFPEELIESGCRRNVERVRHTGPILHTHIPNGKTPREFWKDKVRNKRHKPTIGVLLPGAQRPNFP
jgi:hypothetical protein